MWARVVEVMLGCWLLISPFVFRNAHDQLSHWASGLAGCSTILLALLSYWEPLRHAHLGSAVVALSLIGFGMAASFPTPPSWQNNILTGFILLMVAIVPNESNLPPRSWRMPPPDRGS